MLSLVVTEDDLAGLTRSTTARLVAGCVSRLHARAAVSAALTVVEVWTRFAVSQVSRQLSWLASAHPLGGLPPSLVKGGPADHALVAPVASALGAAAWLAVSVGFGCHLLWETPACVFQRPPLQGVLMRP